MSELAELKNQTRILKKILKVLLHPYDKPDREHTNLPKEEK